jgi:integrase
VRRDPIRKEASGRYVVVIDTAAPGEKRRQTKRRFDTYKEARAWLAKTRVELSEQRFVKPQRLTVGQYVSDWLPVLRTQVRESTASSYERNLRLHVLPHIGDKPLQALRAADLNALYAQLLETGRLNHKQEIVGGLSSTTVSYIHTIIGKCLEAAVRGDLIQTNPARRAEVPKTSAKADRHSTMKTWNKDQLGTFLSSAQTHQHFVPWLLLATTGLRRGEALGLAWADVDIEEGRLTVRRTLVDVELGVPKWSDPKTARGRRTVALDTRTIAHLRTYRAEQLKARLLVGAAYTDHDLVFARVDGKPIHPDRFARAFIERTKAAGLPVIRLHDLRHTWATLALQAGVHPKVVQERLGHSSISVTLDIYSHVVPAMETDAADKVASMIFGGATSA